MDAIAHLFPRLNENGDCTQATCPPSQSVYGYRPFLSATLVFLIAFALSGCLYTWQGLKSKTWFFSSVMVLGCLSETLGYVAKLLLWDNPFSDAGFKMSVVLLTFAPAFYSAGIYYTLKHICLTFGSSFSRLRPAWYTYVFIGADLFSIILQACGGAIASASPNQAVLTIGDNVTIAGLATQVFTMLAFGLLAADYGLAIHRNRTILNPDTAVLRNSTRFKAFIVALWVAYACILARCAYRLAELSGGWSDGNAVLHMQGLFIGLDSVPCAIAALVLNAWHPGWCFPKEEQDIAERAASDDEKVVGGEESDGSV